jgi:excisionase family DNA binding protein
MQEQTMVASPPTLLLTILEAAQRLNLSRSLMYDLVLSGQVVSLKIGRARRIPASEIQAFIDRQLATLGQDEGVN